MITAQPDFPLANSLLPGSAGKLGALVLIMYLTRDFERFSLEQAEG